jgi:hypothetical protein
MSLVAFKPTISEGERPQTYALDRAVTGTGIHFLLLLHILKVLGLLLSRIATVLFEVSDSFPLFFQ